MTRDEAIEFILDHFDPSPMAPDENYGCAVCGKLVEYGEPQQHEPTCRLNEALAALGRGQNAKKPATP